MGYEKNKLKSTKRPVKKSTYRPPKIIMTVPGATKSINEALAELPYSNFFNSSQPLERYLQWEGMNLWVLPEALRKHIADAYEDKYAGIEKELAKHDIYGAGWARDIGLILKWEANEILKGRQ